MENINIKGPWEKNTFGFYPLDRNKAKPKEWGKVKDKLKPDAVEGSSPAPERDEFYKVSYAWQKTSTSMKFPAEMGKNAKRLMSEDEEEELNKFITEDKNKLRQYNARLVILYKRKGAKFDGARDHIAKTAVREEEKSGSARASDKERSVYMVKEAINAIKADGFRDQFLTVSVRYSNQDFGKAALLWEGLSHTRGLKTLRNFRVLGRCFYYMISYKGQEKEIRIRAHNIG